MDSKKPMNILGDQENHIEVILLTKMTKGWNKSRKQH